MCLIALAFKAHPDYPLLLAANRDEFFARPSAAAEWWSDGLFAGRDLEANGTWLGVGRDGRFAAVTNFRGLDTRRPGGPSRGELVPRFLRGEPSFEEFLTSTADDYAGYNLLFGSPEDMLHFSNVSRALTMVEPGVHALSNALLDTPWPKVQFVRRELESLLSEQREAELVARLFAMLSNDHTAPDEDLPDTGVGLPLERGLSPIFIRLPGYGTRCSTVILFRTNGSVRFVEHGWDKHGVLVTEVEEEF